MRLLLASVSIIVFTGLVQAQGGENVVYELHHDDNMDFYFNHSLSKGETVYSLSGVYNIPIKRIENMNPALDLGKLQLNQIIMIPLASEQLQMIENDRPLFTYRVKRKETLYTIAKKYFNKDVEEIKRFNGLLTNDIRRGQVLKIGYLVSHQPQQGNSTTKESHSSIPASEKSILELIDLIKDTVEVVYNIKESSQEETAEFDEPKVEEIGIAFTENLDLYGEQLFVLHPRARVNSTMELINPMLRTSALATVISELPGHLYGDKISVVISPGVASALGAKDKQFLVEMKYVVE